MSSQKINGKREKQKLVAASGLIGDQLINAKFSMAWFLRSMSIGHRPLLYFIYIRRRLEIKLGLNQYQILDDN